jgi:hypothetical protein
LDIESVTDLGVKNHFVFHIFWIIIFKQIIGKVLSSNNRISGARQVKSGIRPDTGYKKGRSLGVYGLIFGAS